MFFYGNTTNELTETPSQFQAKFLRNKPTLSGACTEACCAPNSATTCSVQVPRRVCVSVFFKKCSLRYFGTPAILRNMYQFTKRMARNNEPENKLHATGCMH